MPRKNIIPATVRNAVWNKYVGENTRSVCFCCKSEPITKANFDAGHVEAEANGGQVNIDNLRPICKLCNTSMGTKNMDCFMKQYGFDKILTYQPINEEYYNAIHVRKMIKKIENKNIVNKITELFTKNINMTKLQLQQLCYANDLPISGTIQKLSLRLAHITPIINKQSKYFVVCEGDITIRCDKCVFVEEIDFTVQCDTCRTYHTYYTDTDFTHNKIWKNNKIEIKQENTNCEICKVPRYMKIFYNSFYENLI